MEGANKNNINLESGLDISSSDMLVPFGQQTFQHNWQKFQGKFLPNSLRFEKNGWAAGWNVYNFNYSVFRKKLAEGVYAELGSFNTYTKLLSIYDTKESFDSLKDYFVIQDSVVLAGNAVINDNKITGTIKDTNKPYSLTWDPVAHTITSDTAGVSVSTVINDDKSITATVVDDASSFNFDFDLLLQSSLKGDSINEVNYEGFKANKHSWGNYSYDINSNILTTPEGVTVTPALTDGNKITFNYETEVTDEKLNLAYNLDRYYTRFNGITCRDQTNEVMTIGSAPSQNLAIDRYFGSTVPKDLLVKNEDGVVIDMTLPVWASCGFKVQRANPRAKICNNCRNYEVAVHVGTGLNTKVSYKNVFTGDTHDEELDDNYRQSTSKGRYPQYLDELTYRFNQILVGNTIEKAKDWSPLKYTLSSADLWPLNTRQYENLRNKKTSQMTKYLGDVYTWGSFTYKAAEYFKSNEPFDWTVNDNAVYTKASIDNILSIKLKDEDDNINTGSDEQFVKDNLPDAVAMLETYVAKLTGTVTEYSPTQPAVHYEDLYNNGMYIYGTYETVGVNTEEDSLWPFEKIPKFNVVLDDGTTVTDVYWTDGVDVVTDLDDFKALVLGNYSPDYDKKDTILVENAKYSRKRIVKQYRATYDFNFIRRADYDSQQDYADAKDKFNAVWTKYYFDVQSPLDMFDEEAVSSDTTYLDFENIENLTDVEPEISFIQPGVYIFDTKSVPYNNSAELILYDNTSSYTLTPFIYHHAVDAFGMYDNKHTLHEPGNIKNGSDSLVLPYYFGSAMSLQLDQGTNNLGRFSSTRSASTIESASLTIGVNYAYVGHWYYYESSGSGSQELIDIPDTDPRFPADVTHLSKGWVTYIWEKRTPTDDNWLGNVLLKYNKGFVSVLNATLNNNVEQIDKYQCIGDVNDGIKFAWPIKGHTATRLTYPVMMPKSRINEEGVFVLSKVDSADLANPNLVYVDRNDVDKGQLLFNVIKNSTQPDDSQGKGDFCVTVEPVGNAFLWYAKKQVDSNQKEIYSPYYLPGIVFSNIEDTSGNMYVAEQYPVLKLEWHPVSVEMPTTAIVKFSNLNTLNSAHSFFSNTNILLNYAFELGDYDVENARLPMYLKKDGVVYEMYYDTTSQGTVAVSGNTELVNDSKEVVTTGTVESSRVSADIALNIKLNFTNNTARFYKVPDTTFSLNSAEAYKLNIKKGSVDLVYDVLGQKVLSPKCDISVTLIPNGQHLKINGSAKEVVTAMLKSVFDGILSGTVITFVYKGTQYTFDIKEAESVNTGISVLSTDIRHAEDTKTIGLLRPEGQYQLLRQQWNTTVEVENYWWIDAKHILELNQYNFVLKRNTEELDDWNGNRFEKVGEVPRDQVLPSNIVRYYVTNMYKSSRSAMIVTLQIELGKIVVKLIDPREKFTEYARFSISVVGHDLDEILNNISIEGNTALFNTYNPLTADQILSKAEWTNTVVGNVFILGCHLSNNFDQWAIAYDLTDKTIKKCIQGYGYVGLHGDLTGGQIPNDYFNEEIGFNDKVQPLSVLIKTGENLDENDLDAAYEVGNIANINNITPRVVGTSEQQWYIKQTVYGIVSHLTFDGSKFIKQLLPITNNFSAVYKSPSFSSSILGDAMVQMQGFSTLFRLEDAAQVVWTTLMTFCGFPLLYYLAPRYSVLNYLQQTFGQYAYVHYNSSKSMPEQEISNSKTNSGINEAKNKQTDPVLSNSFTFDKQKFSQKVESQLDLYYGGILAIMISAMSAGLEFIDAKMSLNEDQNQTATSDIGKKFLDNAVANVGDMIAAGIMTQSKNNTGLTSTVTGLKSLDMFYSTCDQQRVFAGPGYVEHQFVADCVAQSVTDVQVEGKVQALFFCIRALTTLQMNIEVKLEELAADALDKAADATAAQMVCGTSLGAVAVGMHAAASVIRAAIATQQIAMVEIDKILDVICQNGITVNVDGAISKHALTVEGKHKYGEKNEVFMWPCWGISAGQLKYTDEYVDSGVRNTPWKLNLKARGYYTAQPFNMVNLISSLSIPTYSSNKADKDDMRTKTGTGGSYTNSSNDDKEGDCYRAYFHQGDVPFYQASAIGVAKERVLPDDMAKVEGVVRFLPNEPFKNENIGQSDPAFAPSMIHDYIIDKAWDLSQCCSYGLQQWVTVKDTKITNCPPSNIVITDSFCGVACPYSAIEVKRGIQKAYMRPWAITPNTLALNCTGYNTILDNKLYHSFDGISYRLVDLVGSPGMNKNRQSFWYAFQVNDRFKRSNIAPANEMQGNFESEPVQAAATIDKMWTVMTISAKEKGLEAGTVGEDKDAIRWAIPVFTEQVSILPAAVKTMAASTLAVVEGVTSLVTAQVTDTNSAYKAPLSVDFTIGKNVYRATEEYICSVTPAEAGNIITDLIPSLGLKYIGATPTEAFFYSKSTRCYYSFTGAALTKMDMMERFRDIQKGYWDFVNQEVVMPCLMTFKRLNEEVEDKDTETDNVIVPVLSKGQVSGELPPPITTIFNDRSWYKCVSLPCGFAYQGPNRVIINRSVFVEYMLDTMKANMGKWSKMNREEYVTHREYTEKYKDVMTNVKGVEGWTYNPFVLVTSALGNSEDTDALYEWNITFCWPIEMDLLYGTDNYACVNIVAETMTPGGKVKSRPTHVFLTKELFTRNGNYGYYSFRFQSKNGAGNRERLHIWSDQYIAISSINCESKVVTSRRTEQLTQQIDVQKLKEL